jgi:prepilin-type N-terminal cleavage/methylation domain-containing protein
MKKVQGFTLVEMLVVMGIIVLLMAMGIGGGRIALQNASSVAFKSGAKQINEALLTHYAATGSYPVVGTKYPTLTTTPKGLIVTAPAPLKDYIESFDGGNDTYYYYLVLDSGQVSLVCVDLAPNLTAVRDVYCEGNGFGTTFNAANSNVTGATSMTINDRTLTATTTPTASAFRTNVGAGGTSEWTGKVFP